MACIEAARSICHIENASSTEFGATAEPVVGTMTEWMKGNELEIRKAGGDLGGTMRLGAFDATLEGRKQDRRDLWFDRYFRASSSSL
jgi:CTP synthase